MKHTDKWPSRLIRLANQIAGWSKDTTKVGAVIVGPGNEIRSTGFNGPPPGVFDRPERFVRPEKYLWCAHAEQNAISQAARVGTPLDGCTLVCTHYPCSRCAQMIIGAGIKRVIVGPGTTSMPEDEFKAAQVMFYEAGVGVTALCAEEHGTET